MFCPECGSKNTNDTKFCKECGRDLKNVSYDVTEYDNPKSINSNIKMRLDGFRDSYYSICLTEEGVIIGKGGRKKSDKMEFNIIHFENIENIKCKNLWGGGEIKIKTKDPDKFKAQGFNLNSAMGFVDFVKKILSGEMELLNDSEQVIKTDEIPIYSTNLNKPYVDFGKISVRADSSPFSKTATMYDVNARLKEEAIRLGANAIINTQYKRSSLTSWRGIKATGTAVYIQSDEKKCPFCAEKIKREAIKCKHCGSDLG